MTKENQILKAIAPERFDAARAKNFDLTRAKGNLSLPAPVERMINVDEEKRTADFAFASNKPIEHWFGYLILDTDKKSVVLDRVNQGVCPHLVNHDVNQQVGVVVADSVSLGDMVRGTVKFSQSECGKEIFQDVVDEIRAGVSFGFLVHDMVMESESDGIPTYRATKWEIIETTSASIPADISVGFGRSFETKEENSQPKISDKTDAPVVRDISNTKKENNMENEEVVTPAPQAPATVETRSKTVDAAREIIEFGELFGEKEMARSFASEGKSIQEFRTALNEKRAKSTPVPPKPGIELNEKEIQQYSIARAILADANIRDGKNENSFEVEVSQEILRKINAPGVEFRGGILIPTNVRVLKDQMLKRAGLDTASATKGQTTVFTEFGGSLIELLRNKAKVLLLGATVLPGLQGNVSFPRQNGSGSVSWVGENPGADVADSNLTLDNVSLSPKTLQSTTSYSRQLLAQGAINVDSLVANDLASINALEIDRASLHGTNAANQPEGIYAAAGVNSVAFGGTVSFDKLVDMETEIATDNADMETMAYLTTPGVKGKAKKTPELANTVNNAIWRNNEINGYRAEASNQVSKILGVGTNEHGIILAVWSELLFGEWGAMEIITDPYRLKKQGMIEVTTFNMVDIKRRHDEAFCKGTGLIP